MTKEQLPAERASQLQKAIDTIVGAFEYPTDVSIEYMSENGKKRTRFTVKTANESRMYELSYDGNDEEREPELVSFEEH